MFDVFFFVQCDKLTSTASHEPRMSIFENFVYHCLIDINQGQYINRLSDAARCGLEWPDCIA